MGMATSVKSLFAVVTLVVEVLVAVVAMVVVVFVLVAVTLQISLLPPSAPRSLGIYRHIFHGEVSSLELLQGRKVNDPGFAGLGKVRVNYSKVRRQHGDDARCGHRFLGIFCAQYKLRLLGKLSPSRLPWCLSYAMRTEGCLECS
jgi:hypothetical protein